MCRIVPNIILLSVQFLVFHFTKFYYSFVSVERTPIWGENHEMSVPFTVVIVLVSQGYCFEIEVRVFICAKDKWRQLGVTPK